VNGVSGARSAPSEVAAWTVALALAALSLAALDYHARDPDSVLYARIAADLAKRPVSEWIAPTWPAGAYMQGYFREHPVGLFVPAALFARAGYPAEQAAYALNALYQALTLALVPRLALAVAPAAQARALGILLQLLPIAFAYRIRANHEPLLLLCFIVALLGVEHSRRDGRWGALTVLGLAGLLLVKGMLAAPALLACAAWAWLRPAPDGKSRTWIPLGLAAAALAGLVAFYESAYRTATGESFLGYYVGRWVGDGSLRSPLDRSLGFGYVFIWYAARVIWFAFPWSLAALAAIPAAARGLRARHAAAFALVVTLLYLVPFAFSERKAERYIFPVYFVVASAGWLATFGRFPRLAALAQRLERWPHATVLLWLALFALHIAAGYGQLPRIKLWAPDS
jgi:4-amino-4-deoxy-L-arabinose transferase-like glycosyltransferase